MKSCILRSVYGLLGAVFVFSGTAMFVRWLNDRQVAGVHGRGLLIYVAIFALLGLVGIWGAVTKWNQ
jgi:uncharacterized membrane protein